MRKLDVLIAGSTGYIGIQLIKLLVNHKNVNICASAYNKKQEFDGAIIFLKDNKCKIENINNDDSSKIIF